MARRDRRRRRTQVVRTAGLPAVVAAAGILAGFSDMPTPLQAVWLCVTCAATVALAIMTGPDASKKILTV